MAFLGFNTNWQSLIALPLAVVVGLFTIAEAGLFQAPFYSIFALAGKLFLDSLNMLIVLLIAFPLLGSSASVYGAPRGPVIAARDRGGEPDAGRQGCEGVGQ